MIPKSRSGRRNDLSKVVVRSYMLHNSKFHKFGGRAGASDV